jgi:hypothetical protein
MKVHEVPPPGPRAPTRARVTAHPRARSLTARHLPRHLLRYVIDSQCNARHGVSPTRAPRTPQTAACGAEVYRPCARMPACMRPCLSLSVVLLPRSTCRPPTVHLPSTCRPPTVHLPSTCRPPTVHLPSTPYPPHAHLPPWPHVAQGAMRPFVGNPTITRKRVLTSTA